MESKEVLPRCHFEALDLMPQPLLVVSEKSVLLQANRAALAILGFRLEEVTNMPLDALFLVPGDRLQAMKCQVPETMRCKDGTPLPVEISSKKALHETAVVSLISFRDMTKSRAIEREIEEENEFAKMIPENSQDIFLSCASDFRIMFVCAQIRDILGYEPEIIQKMTLKELRLFLFEPDRHIFDVAFERIQADKSDYVIKDELTHLELCVVQFEARYQAKSGEIIPIETIITYKHNSDRLQRKYYVGAFRKITERIQTHKEERKRSVDDGRARHSGAQNFCAFMLQMLKDPVGKFSQLASLQREECPSRLATERLLAFQNIAHSTNQMKQVASDITQLVAPSRERSLVATDRFTILQEEFSLRYLMNLCVSQYAQQAFGKKMQLSVRVADDVPDTLLGDPTRLFQIFSNLMKNAITYSFEGGSATLSARIQSQDGKNVCINIQVADTGVGIAKDEQERLFQPFSQLAQGMADRPLGSGLGLSICNLFITKMGGKIQVESIKGRGSTFTVILPFSIP